MCGSPPLHPSTHAYMGDEGMHVGLVALEQRARGSRMDGWRMPCRSSRVRLINSRSSNSSEARAAISFARSLENSCVVLTSRVLSCRVVVVRGYAAMPPSRCRLGLPRGPDSASNRHGLSGLLR